MFSGCGTGKRESKYPYIEYRASEYNYDKDNDIIYIPNGLEIDEFSPYTDYNKINIENMRRIIQKNGWTEIKDSFLW